MYERTSAATDEDVVVFLLGMHVNNWRKVGEWLAVSRAMRRMLVETAAQPDLGLLKAYGGWVFGGPVSLQYWRSVDDLVAYARRRDAAHLPAWRAFNAAARRSDAVGIWHETYRVRAGEWETVYGAAPDIGLAGAVGGRLLQRGSTTRTRLDPTAADVPPVPAP